jgi:hypothetical protein
MDWRVKGHQERELEFLGKGHLQREEKVATDCLTDWRAKLRVVGDVEVDISTA